MGRKEGRIVERGVLGRKEGRLIGRDDYRKE
jgi:hypothetical protein